MHLKSSGTCNTPVAPKKFLSSGPLCLSETREEIPVKMPCPTLPGAVCPLKAASLPKSQHDAPRSPAGGGAKQRAGWGCRVTPQLLALSLHMC